MPEDKIQHRDLWQRLNNIRPKDWENTGRRLKLAVSKEGGKGSHCVIRDPAYPDQDYKGLITTIPRNLYKELNQAIFKQIFKFGIPEDDIWRALKMLK